MSNNERIYRIDNLLHDRKIVSFQELLDRLEVSPATLKRDLAYMRDRLNAPIIYDKESNGYRFDSPSNRYSLPGLWFSPDEIYALLTMNHLLNNLDEGGLLSKHINPLRSRLLALLDGTDVPMEEIKNRVRIERIGAKKINLSSFQDIGSALVKRRRLLINYHSRGRDEFNQREVSPQRLVYYRDNWYLDAYCHLKNALRSFSVDAISKVAVLEVLSKDVSSEALDEELSAGYGIFAGKNIDWAKLKFTPERAKWVSNEVWHPNQIGRFLESGYYELSIPFSDERELLMDILKYGSDIEVIGPETLIIKVQDELKKTLKTYKAKEKSLSN